MGTCLWAYKDAAQCKHAAGTTSYAKNCLGAESAGDVSCNSDLSSCATTTGSSYFAQCSATTTNGSIYDLSGNVKEWTYTSPATGLHEQRGGSYNNLEAGRSCEFNFTVGGSSFRFPTTGFRCCYYP